MDPLANTRWRSIWFDQIEYGDLFFVSGHLAMVTDVIEVSETITNIQFEWMFNEGGGEFDLSNSTRFSVCR